MVDRVSLEVMGFIFGGVTALVMAIGAVVVTYHLDGRVALDQTQPAQQTQQAKQTAIIPVSLTPRR